jgi:7,8-dihydro-6-hydroxymethylpterin dimethyltransferase
MTSTLTKWYEEHGRHEIFAGGKKVGLEKEAKYDLVLNQTHIDAAANDTFEKSGIAKNSREEKIRARDAKIKQDAENARMAKLYRKEVLKEPDAPAGFISLGEIKPATPIASKAEVVQNIEETVSGD